MLALLMGDRQWDTWMVLEEVNINIFRDPSLT